jgi:uncharacterized protein (DUF433 family)
MLTASIPNFVSIAEASFIAGVSDRHMNRVVDEGILPPVLFRADDGRRYARLGAALASFYFEEENVLVAGARKSIIAELVLRLSRRTDWDLLINLPVNLPRTIDWRVSMSHIDCNVLPFIDKSIARIIDIDSAESLVTCDAEILSGTPIFKGTRVPIDMVVASADKGIDVSRIRTSYPFVTEEHIKAARIYAAVHPKKGRPLRISESHPDLKPIRHGVIRRVPVRA